MFGRYARSALATMAIHMGIATAAGLLLYLVIDLVEVGNLSSERGAAGMLGRLTLWNVPRVIRTMLPVAAPVGALTAVASLVRQREIEALFAAGASPLLGAIPALAAALFSALIFAANVEWLVPLASSEVGALRKRMGLGRGPLEVYGKRQSWFQGRDLVYRVARLGDASGAALDDVLVLRLAGGAVVERWDLDSLTREGEQWIGRGVVHRVLGDRLSTTRTASAVMPVRESPQDFVLSVAPPERLSTPELLATAAARERIGRPSPVHWTEAYRRATAPLSLALSVLLASALALRLGRRVTLAAALGAGALLGLGAWFLGDLGALVGASGAAAPWAAALSTPAILALLLAHFGRTVARRGVGE